MDRAPELYVSVERKRNLGNFESETIGISVSRLPFNAHEDLIQECLQTAEITVEAIRDQIRGRIARIRNEKAFEPAIPSDEEIYVPTPRDTAECEPITDGQLVAVNAALSSWGITGAERFNAIERITNKRFKSTKDMMKADANDVLDYISNADDSIRATFTGQGALV